MPRSRYLTNADRAMLRPKIIKFHKNNPSFTKTQLAKKFEVSYQTIKNWVEFDEKFEQDNNSGEKKND